MILAKIIEELPKLSAEERSIIWQRLEEITEADVPASFRQGMKDIARGRHVDMERALAVLVPMPFTTGPDTASCA